MAAQLSATSPGDTVDPAPKTRRSEADIVQEAEEHVEEEVRESGEELEEDVREKAEKETGAEVVKSGVRT